MQNQVQDSTLEPHHQDAVRTTYHIYPEKERHKRIQTNTDLKKESPRSAVQRAARKEKKEAKKNVAIGAKSETSSNPDPELELKTRGDSFFLHTPYLAFHSPPQVLYAGTDKQAPPTVLIHGSTFWRKYKLQYGDSLATGVLDPRGVVAWKHNGGTKKDLQADDKKLKGYRDRTWRLWGETGKAYVHSIKTNRKAGVEPDPGNTVDSAVKRGSATKADGVVYLAWEHPFSRNTRQYHFRFSDLDFYWKGTSRVKKPGFCGFFVRYNHLKLIVKTSASDYETGAASSREVCLGTYTCSVSKKKNGRLELFDSVILRFAEVHGARVGVAVGVGEGGEVTAENLKKTMLYQIIVATAMCMVQAEKEKRETVWEWLENAGEGGG
jgi:hypothetical protein